MKAHGVLLLVVGCAEPTLPDGDDGSWDGWDCDDPVLVLDPTWLNFGTVAVDDLSDHAQTVALRNERHMGEMGANLYILSIELSDPDAPFALTIDSIMVPPGGESTLTVDFSPILDGEHNVTLAIESDDPWHPVVRLPVRAEGLAPDLLVDSRLDFGEVPLGCSADASLFLANTGSLGLTVEDIAWHHGDSAFALPNLTSPLVLAPDEHVALTFEFTPTAEGEVLATFLIASDDPAASSTMVTLAGTSEASWTTDTHTQPGLQPADVLIAPNLGATMEPYAVADQLTAFATEAVAAHPDARVGITVADDGCLAGPWIDVTTADVPAAVAAMLSPGPGSSTERAFTLMEAALAATGAGGCNEGFLREDGRLLAVGISDEPEQSANPWSYYTTLLQSYRDDGDDVVISAVGGDYPGGCGEASAYTGLYEASVATDGLFLSICGPAWGPDLVPITAAVDGRRDRFFLTADPVEDTIAVTVDELPETRWSYLAATDEVVFDPDAIPEQGAEIAITYAVMPHCGD